MMSRFIIKLFIFTVTEKKKKNLILLITQNKISFDMKLNDTKNFSFFFFS